MKIVGLYRPGTAWLYHIDPRAKVVVTVLFLIGVALSSGAAATVAAAGATVCLWTGTGQSFGRAGTLLRPVLPLLAFIFLVNTLAWAAEGAFTGTFGAEKAAAVLASALAAVLKLACGMVGAATLMMTTDPERLTVALRAFARPFCREGRRADEYAFMLAAAFRFVPQLADEALKIKKAQMSRGASLDTGGLAARVRAWVPVLTPLFAQSLRRADRMAFAVANRGFFSPGRRSSLVRFQWRLRDSVLCAGAVGYVIIMLICS